MFQRKLMLILALTILGATLAAVALGGLCDGRRCFVEWRLVKPYNAEISEKCRRVRPEQTPAPFESRSRTTPLRLK